MKVYCDACSSEIHKKPREIRRYKYHFCDAKCYGVWQREHKSRQSFWLSITPKYLRLRLRHVRKAWVSGSVPHSEIIKDNMENNDDKL